MIGRVPVLRQHNCTPIRQRHQTADGFNDSVAFRNGKGAARQEIVLKVDDKKGVLTHE